MKAVHPQSRKAGQSRRRLHHDIRVNKRQKQQNLKQKLIERRLAWFRDNYPDESAYLTHVQLVEMTDRYLQRKSEKTEHHLTEEHVSVTADMCNAFLEQEKQEFRSCGLRVPDLTSKKNVANLRAWKGDKSKIPSINLCTIKKPQR
ncbi:hypothetical protein FBUS_09911 [Fasciolopsis buskii]|uniref:Translation machinery-associated protein 16 n=1 Tax=Fasciolopsis buskii TaxID=27845 RepID=A0A8E0RPG5_9TREM|nr:hypothetical protein FBUS_09911 [Fasciolopsis buski]